MIYILMPAAILVFAAVIAVGGLVLTARDWADDET